MSELKRNMYDRQDASVAQRITLAGCGGAWIALAWWLLLGGGLGIAEGWFAWIGKTGDAAMRLCLAVGLSIWLLQDSLYRVCIP